MSDAILKLKARVRFLEADIDFLTTDHKAEIDILTADLEAEMRSLKTNLEAEMRNFRTELERRDALSRSDFRSTVFVIEIQVIALLYLVLVILFGGDK